MKSRKFKTDTWQGGMTLIEVVVSITILSLILVLLISTIHTSARSWNIIESYTDAADSRRLGLQFIQKQIYQAVPLKWKGADGEKLIFIGSARRMDFVSRLPSHFNENGLKMVSLRFVSEGKKKRLVFSYRSLHPDISPFELISAHDNNVVTIFDEIHDIHIDYFGKTAGSSQAVWISSWSDKKLMPGLIRLRIRYEQSDSWHESIFPVFAQIHETLPQLTITQKGLDPPTTQDMDQDMELF